MHITVDMMQRMELLLHLGEVAVDVEWILGQVMQVFQHDKEKSRAVDSRQIKSASMAWILSIKVETNYSTCCINNNGDRLSSEQKNEELACAKMG